MTKLIFIYSLYAFRQIMSGHDSTHHIVIFILLCVLLSISISTAAILYRKYGKLKKETSDHLQEVQQLKAFNNQLKQLNRSREIHFRPILALCSDSLTKMETYRLTINRKIKAGQYNEVSRMTASPIFLSQEMKAFHQSFDTLFLNLYPSFIKEINELLLPGKQIKQRKAILLTPELRVFALIKMGIINSRQIATLLHYSPQTVYNYKLKLFNKSDLSKKEFIQRLQTL